MTSTPAAAGERRPGLKRHLPEPAKLWLAWAPGTWPSADAPWTDLAGGRLRGLGGAVRSAAPLPELDATDLDDLFYLPPAAADLAADRDRWAAGLIESGTPVLLQLEPGDASRVPDVHTVYDLAAPLLAGELAPLARVGAGSAAVWPLVGGVTDAPELVDRGCEVLADAGAACVQPLAVDLAPADRRRLAELGGDGVFEALFHGAAPSERDFSRRARRLGLAAFWPRPESGRSARRRRNRRLAGDLALAGELWLRLGRSTDGGQGLLRSARGADATRRDLEALSREGNLDVLEWLDARSREAVLEIVAEGRSTLLDALLEEYLEG